MSQVNEFFFLKSGNKSFEHNIRSHVVRNYDDLILNLRAIFGKEEKQENSYFYVKEAGFGSYVVYAFVEKRDLEDDLSFLTTATMVTSVLQLSLLSKRNNEKSPKWLFYSFFRINIQCIKPSSRNTRRFSSTKNLKI